MACGLWVALRCVWWGERKGGGGEVGKGLSEWMWIEN